MSWYSLKMNRRPVYDRRFVCRGGRICRVSTPKGGTADLTVPIYVLLNPCRTSHGSIIYSTVLDAVKNIRDGYGWINRPRDSRARKG